MEQKKILWIFSILMAFLVVVFGLAWYFYHPSRHENSAKITKLEEEFPSRPNLASIDADAWAKREVEVPTPQGTIPASVTIDNNVTIVTGENEKNVDVTSLLDNTEKVEGELPASISNTITAHVTQQNKSQDTVTSASENSKSEKETTGSKTSTEAKSSQTKKETVTNTPKTTTKATTEKVSTPQTVYWVQTASLTSRIYAEEARNRLQEKNLKAEIFTKETVQGLVHRVRVGPFENKTEATYWLSTIKKIDGFEGSFVSEEKL
ncbi:MAG: SPOR domain-containing protein [Spirochaetaceae bacterium]|nr:SPOR domain-containing protein [Spirochaetaceae bacterium]